MLDTIGLHHGIYSADPPYSIIEVFGATLTEPIRAALVALGFARIELRPAGFLAFQSAQP